jgi:hypothetical protein
VKRVFILGCPRSGTTWTRLLLAQHPRIATGPETHLFNRYLGPLEATWRDMRDMRGHGLALIMSDEDFYGLCREFAEKALAKIEAARPGAAVIAEKTPWNALHWRLIHRLFPDAYFLHVLRDPRDTACSMLAAGRKWAAWAPTGVVSAARVWRNMVEQGLAVAAATERHAEVRYERLIADGAAELERIFAWLGEPVPRAVCDAAVEACRFEKLREARIAQNANPAFLRRGEAGAWRDELSAAQVAAIEFVAGDFMDRLGYERASRRRRARPASVWFHDLLEALKALNKRARRRARRFQETI